MGARVVSGREIDIKSLAERADGPDRRAPVRVYDFSGGNSKYERHDHNPFEGLIEEEEEQ